MTLEFGLWRAEPSALQRLTATGVPLESQLEDYIEADPALLGARLLLIGRQVPTGFGGFIDLLGVDAEGTVHVIELKRDKTPRDVVAQALDYASWVSGLDHGDVLELFERYKPETAFDEAFAATFGGDAPDELNAQQSLAIVAASIDPSTERIVRFLNESYGVPINVVFFRHFEDRGSSYLARTWLVTAEAETAARPATRTPRTREPWNGRDWYVSFGDETGGRSWTDALRYGFVSAGGGEWYSRSLKNLPIGARVFVCIPKRGYVGVGEVAGEARPFSTAQVKVRGEWHPLAELDLAGSYEYSPEGDEEADAEWVVPVEWVATVEASQAIWKTGMFANQNSACRLSKQFTIDTVTNALGIPDE